MGALDVESTNTIADQSCRDAGVPSGPPVALSVCLITHNHRAYIEAAIRSVLMQKLDRPWELIISDDSSTDGTGAIVAALAREHPGRIRDISPVRNLGASANLLRVFQAARGEYVAYLEGDDRYTDELKLQLQVNFLEQHPSCIGCFHDVAVVDAEDRVVYPSFLTSQGSLFLPFVEQEHLLESGAIAQTSSWFFRRRCLDALPGWVVELPLDKSLAFHFARHGSWGYIDRIMSVYRLHGDGTYSPLSRQQQNSLLLRQALAVYGVPEYRAQYRRALLLKICHYCRTLAGTYRRGSAPYFGYLLKYFRYAPNKMSALKVLVVELLRTQPERVHGP